MFKHCYRAWLTGSVEQRAVGQQLNAEVLRHIGGDSVILHVRHNTVDRIRLPDTFVTAGGGKSDSSCSGQKDRRL